MKTLKGCLLCCLLVALGCGRSGYTRLLDGCTNDLDCPLGRVCVANACVECRDDTDCDSRMKCRENICESFIQTCDGNTHCNSHGSCAYFDEIVLCDCDQGYSGDRCEACATGYVEWPVSSGTCIALAWLDPWTYRIPITINGSSFDLIDYQVYVIVDTSSLIAAGKMKSDCSDLRFTDADGATEIPFWFNESECDSANTQIWVKTPLVTTTETTIYMYYGNNSATNTSNDMLVFVNISPLANGGAITHSGVDACCPASQAIDEDIQTGAYFKTDSSEWLIRDFSTIVFIHAMRGHDSSSGSAPYVYLQVSDDGSEWTTIGEFDEDLYDNIFSHWFFNNEKHQYARWYKTGIHWYSIQEWEISGFIPASPEPIAVLGSEEE